MFNRNFLIGIFLFYLNYDVISIKVDYNSTEYWLKLQEFLEDTQPITDVDVPPVTKDQVQFYYTTNSDRENLTHLTENNLNIIKTDVDKLFFLIHGWLESRHEVWYDELKNALLSRYPNSGVIEVDYSDPAFDFYPRAMSSAKYVGELVGNMLTSISTKNNISSKKLIILAHSLGSHVAGFAGKTVQKSLPKIARIISMDPAGPGWTNKPCEKRLCKTDADIVEVIHTDSGDAGYPDPLGTIDFYANGGYTQNGCEKLEGIGLSACDHARSYKYMIEAMKNPKHFISRKCSDWKTYLENHELCDTAVLALGDIDATDAGIYYFRTHPKAPFALEDDDSKGTSLVQSSGQLAISMFVAVYLLRNLVF